MSFTLTSIYAKNVRYPCDGKIYRMHFESEDSECEILAIDYLRLGITTIQYENGESAVLKADSPDREFEEGEYNASCRRALGLEEFCDPSDILNLVYFFGIRGDSPYTLNVKQTHDIPDEYINAMNNSRRVIR